MTNQELSKVAQAAAYMDVLVIDKETEDFCINNVKRILDELLSKTETITASPLYRGLDSVITPTSTGSHPEHTTITTARNM